MRLPNWLAAGALCAWAIGFAPAALAADPPVAPPATPVRPVTENYFGTPVTDPYRWLEDLKSTEVQAWMKAQAAYTRATLDRLPGRDALAKRIHELSSGQTLRHSIVRRGDRLFYELREPGAQQPKLMVRDGIGGRERLLVDPSVLGAAAGTPHAVDYFEPSWDGSLLAYGLSSGGSEASTMHVLDVATGRDLGERIDRTDGSPVAWRPDNRSFFFMRFNKVGPDTPPDQAQFNARTYLHVVGRQGDGEADVAVFGRGVSNATPVPEGQGTYIVGSPTSRYVLAVANHNLDDNPSTVWVAPLAKVAGPATPWLRVADVADGVSHVVPHGDWLYFLSRKGASRFQILATPLARPDVRQPKVIVAEGAGVVTGFAFAKDGLYYRERTGAVTRLMRTGFDGGAARAVPLPFEGNLFGPVTDPARDGALFNMQSSSRPAQLLAYDPASGAVSDTGMIPPSTVDASQLESREVLVTSYDGTRVPLSIVYRKGLVLDGSHPTILDGYGAYGVVSESYFSPVGLAWIERGGVLATAHVRGGGEYGEDWHRAGMRQTKLNTVFDFIACAQYLIDERYTAPKRLAGAGGSAGGITVGGAMTWRPDLFAVVLDYVGMSDTLRAETEPNGPPNIVEFGSVKDEPGFRGLYAMSPYHRIASGTAYPAVLYITGANDPRVAPWHMMKMAARTQAATSSGKPALLRIDYAAGHGIGSNVSQREQLQADAWAFALWQMGEPGFQP